MAHVPELLIDDVWRWIEWVAAIPSLRCVAAMVVVREIGAVDGGEEWLVAGRAEGVVREFVLVMIENVPIEVKSGNRRRYSRWMSGRSVHGRPVHG